MDGTLESPPGNRDVKNHVVFEVATEVANRGVLRMPLYTMRIGANRAPVGGIYSVIKSKALVSTAEYGDRYTLIGPLNRASV